MNALGKERRQGDLLLQQPMLGLGGAQQSVEIVRILEQHLAMQLPRSRSSARAPRVQDYADPCPEALSRSLASGLRSLAIRS